MTLIRIQIGPKFRIRIKIQCMWIHNTEIDDEHCKWYTGTSDELPRAGSATATESPELLLAS